jgi:hypothetical protein
MRSSLPSPHCQFPAKNIIQTVRETVNSSELKIQNAINAGDSLNCKTDKNFALRCTET